ncbi:hypothetical protein [Streptantibioticus ferralitis]|uniref:Uncharacterized protein n=1 Tax=Streptantibioticus ferralitis TaxID=236510 RepID=A0ABT5Z3F0_9ACTN|nr:hypothetical protein [Streptantibioticus ferralitis]MDF2258356.1 hypothetical protein [Streptantibioticus ferralitis]
MTPDTESLLRDAVERVERAIRARDCPAVVVLEGDRKVVLSDYDYLRDDATAAAFEQRAADQARQIHAARWVLAVPQVWLEMSDGGIAARAVSNLPLREGEQEAITWMSFDATDGVDYGLVPYVRRPNGEPIFDEPERITAAVQPDEYPGCTLLRSLMGDNAHPTSD